MAKQTAPPDSGKQNAFWCNKMQVLPLESSDKILVIWSAAAWTSTIILALSWTLRSESADVILGSAARWLVVNGTSKVEPERLFMWLTATFQNIWWRNWRGYRKEPQKNMIEGWGKWFARQALKDYVQLSEIDLISGGKMPYSEENCKVPRDQSQAPNFSENLDQDCSSLHFLHNIWSDPYPL